MRVVCTAGHVDHGKSTLVEALTGTDPDRFAEERARGLTIDLGFAWTDLIDEVAGGAGPTPADTDSVAAALPPVTVAFVDLPGHERFIGNMLAGAGGVDLALLVVAADAGWMPQSAEHLAILDLLGVRHGLVAVTKTDLVDEETAALAVELVREEVAGTTLANAEILPVSAATGTGLAELRRALHALLAAAPEAQDTGRPRLWVDRAFTISGAGTVVTGTLQGGCLRVGDTLMVLPDEIRGRVRGLQQLGNDVYEATAGTRVAVNLAGVDVGQAPRGTALGMPGQWRPTRILEARVRTLPDARVGRRGAWKLYAGSGVWNARIAPLDAGAIEPGESGEIRVALETPAPLVAGDRFVLRDTGRRATAGGGVVLDADPPPRPRGTAARGRRQEALRARAAALADGDRARLFAQHVAERKLVDPERAAAVTGLEASRIRAAAQAHGLVEMSGSLGDPQALAEWAAAALEVVRAHHARNPVERAARRDVPERALAEHGCPPDRTGAVVDALVDRGDLVAEGPGLRAPEHRPTLDAEQQAARADLLARLSEEPFSPPGLAEAAHRAGAADGLVRELEASGELIRLTPDMAVPASTLDTAHRLLLDAYRSEGALTAARAKEVLGTSRKFALPMLEEMDRRRLTRRVGDRREVVS